MPLRLKAVDEAASMRLVADRAGFLAGAAGLGLRWPVDHGAMIDADTIAVEFASRIGGEAIPPWAIGAGGAWRGELVLSRMSEVYAWPRYGVICDAEGGVPNGPSGEARSWNPDLTRLPFVKGRGGERVMIPHARVERLPAASLFMPFGGLGNYGHFLLDALPALLALEEQDLLGAYPPIATPLNHWRRRLIDLALGDAPIRETKAPLVHLDEVVFASPMDHYLHRPGLIVPRLRRRILDRAPPAETGAPERLYLSRRRLPQRQMLGETALEQALAARGFTVIEPERLSVERQIALIRGAKVVVGASGAALANALWMGEGAKLIEIAPDGFAAPWVRDLCRQIGVEWHGFFCAAPLTGAALPFLPRLKAVVMAARRGDRFVFRLPVEGFLRFLDARL